MSLHTLKFQKLSGGLRSFDDVCCVQCVVVAGYWIFYFGFSYGRGFVCRAGSRHSFVAVQKGQQLPEKAIKMTMTSYEEQVASLIGEEVLDPEEKRARGQPNEDLALQDC